MLYADFERAFETRLQTRADAYVNAVEYHRVQFGQLIAHLLQSILEQTDNLLNQSDAGWAHTEEVVSDILYCADMDVEQLLALKMPNEVTADRDFEAVKTELYETRCYPASEHLNYIAFPPALERKAFIGKHFDRFKADSYFCDLGFGPGVLTAFILAQAASWRAAGVDISKDCLRHAQRLLEKKKVLDRSELSVADVRSLPYPDDTFDVVVAVEVLEHIPDPEAGLAEAMRVLKPGGYAITALPVRLPLWMHLYDFDTPEEVLALYEKVGLEVVDFEEKAFRLQAGTFVDTFALSVNP